MKKLYLMTIGLLIGSSMLYSGDVYDDSVSTEFASDVQDSDDTMTNDQFLNYLYEELWTDSELMTNDQLAEALEMKNDTAGLQGFVQGLIPDAQRFIDNKQQEYDQYHLAVASSRYTLDLTRFENGLEFAKKQLAQWQSMVL